MYKLKEPRTEPFWLTVDKGVELYLKPENPSLMATIGRNAANRVLAAGGDRDEASQAFTVAVARWAALDWKGVGSAKDKTDTPLPFSADGVEALLKQNARAFAELDNEYVLPAILQDEEKNGSSASPTGTSGKAGKATARPARAGAKRAPTTKTPAKPKKAKRSGR